MVSEFAPAWQRRWHLLGGTVRLDVPSLSSAYPCAPEQPLQHPAPSHSAGHISGLGVQLGKTKIKVGFNLHCSSVSCAVEAQPVQGSGRLDGDEQEVFWGRGRWPEGVLRSSWVGRSKPCSLCCHGLLGSAPPSKMVDLSRPIGLPAAVLSGAIKQTVFPCPQ